MDNDFNWKNKEILITGGTGSLGKTLTKLLIKEFHPKGIRILSRDEFKQWEMMKQLIDSTTEVSFLIGDVRDEKRVEMAMRGVDIMIHAAAMKQVPTCESNPLEAVKTNVIGAVSILQAAVNQKVEKVMAISTDKAVYPINLYGATKAVAEKLFLHGNIYSGGKSPLFSCCRYGNVISSRGSVIPVFKKQAKEQNKITITDTRMDRFWITLPRAARFILHCIERMEGGEIFIPYLPSMKITAIAEAVAPGVEIETIGIRPGEKLSEYLIAAEERPHQSLSMPPNQSIPGYFVIKPLDPPTFTDEVAYDSGTNQYWLSQDEMLKMTKEEI